MVTALVANFKGGCGKTTICHHVAVRASERGIRVLAIDTDRQGNLYRRLLSDAGNLLDRPPEEWAPGCTVVYSPEAWALPDRAETSWDLVLVDSAPGHEPPEGPTPELLLVPVDGVDAAMNANETLAWAIESGVGVTMIVFNGIGEGGKTQARIFNQISESLPKGVQVADTKIPRGNGIKRSALDCRPAWKDIWQGRDARQIAAFCDELLDALEGRHGS